MYVYILGAGASRPDGVPVTSEIFSAAFHNLNVKRVDGSYRFISTVSPFEGDPISEFQPVFELFDKWNETRLAPEWSGLREKVGTPLPNMLAVDTPRFEHFYSSLYRMNRGLEPCDLSEEAMRDVWRKAKYLFYHTVGSAGWHRELKHYQVFVERVLAKPGLHCLISFNVDTLLDDRLYLLCRSSVPKTGVWDRKKELEWTYGIEFGTKEGMRHYEFRNDAKILYCKPHGSLHWGLHRTTGQVSLHHPADSCNYEKLFLGEDGKEDALVIPPIEGKEFPSSLREIWKKAFGALYKAEELCVIGYSAPDVDKEAVDLLRKMPTGSLRRVIIANRSEDHQNRILDLLGRPDEKIVTRYDGGFEEYLEKESRVFVD